MTPKDLDTAEAILEWAHETCTRPHRLRDEDYRQPDVTTIKLDIHDADRATAAYLAECVRLRQAWDAQEKLRCTGAPTLPGAEPWTRQTLRLLRAALEGKKP